MIDDYKIFVCSFVSNSITTGYAPMLEPSVLSWCDLPYVDRVIIVDGLSEDGTREVIPNDPKVSVVNGPKWPVSKWTWENVIGAENTYLNAVRDDPYEKKIFAYMSIDNVMYEGNDDYGNACRRMIKEKFDFMTMRFNKALTPRFITRTYPILPPHNWSVFTMTRFDRTFTPTKIVNELKIEFAQSPDRKSKGGDPKFAAAPVSYDMFFFSRQNVEEKGKRHVDFIKRPDKPQIKELVTRQVKKLEKNGVELRPVSLEDHPKRIQASLKDKLTSDHYGYDMFGFDGMLEKLKKKK